MADAQSGGIWEAFLPHEGYSFDGGGAGDYDDPFNVFLSMAPIMQRNMTQQIQSGLAGVGMTGNRYSKDALKVGASAGREAATDMNALLSNVLYNHTQQSLDRQLRAGESMLAATPMVEDALRSRLGFYGDAAGRQQAQANAANSQALARENAARSDWWRRTTWPLEFLGGMARSAGIGVPPQPILSGEGGKDGALDYLGAIYGGGGG